MSSFASRAREEIAARSIQKDCCVRAAAYGIACFAKYFDARGLVVQTEQQETVQAAQQLFARCGVQGEILQKQRPSGVLYEFNIRAPEQVARMHELFGTTGSETSLQIDPRLIRCQTCVSAYIGAAFLCSGTVIDPQKEYNLEFLTSRTNLARDFEALLAEHEFAPHRTRRNGVNLIYVKTGANVERLLSFMGAVNAAEEMQYPDLSLTALCGCFEPAVSKSGLSHRMKKLEALAENLRKNLEQEAQRERDQ